MQFQYNSDYPGISQDGQPLPAAVLEAQSPLEFPPVQPFPCARITTRVYHPTRRQVATVQNVLVRTTAPRRASRRGSQLQGSNPAGGTDESGAMNSSSSSSDDLASSSDESMSLNDDDHQGQPSAAQRTSMPLSMVFAFDGQQEDEEEDDNDRAYWIQRTIREAIYGRVLFAVILRRRVPSLAANDSAEWEVTNSFCAVKEMSWQHIRKERDRLAEDPVKEVAAMQYLRRWHWKNRSRAIKPPASEVDLQLPQQAAASQSKRDTVMDSFRSMLETNIMMPLDLLSDDRHLYSIMPYCDGGELFERLDVNEKFSEEEARYWMYQVLNGLENLQNAGICHRDMSLENLLVHESGALIIDMGMCLRVPFAADQLPTPSSVAFGNHHAALTASMQNMTMNGQPSVSMSHLSTATDFTASRDPGDGMELNCRTRRRTLIRPQGTCGKWIYMSPEIYKDREPFDGYAVDVWAAGVILFLMLTGFPPWERACQTDERFKYMTAGYLVQMLTEWNLGLTGDALDLLQRMLFLDPKDRLSLDQVRAHPWMVNGRLAPPTNIPGF